MTKLQFVQDLGKITPVRRTLDADQSQIAVCGISGVPCSCCREVINAGVISAGHCCGTVRTGLQPAQTGQGERAAMFIDPELQAGARCPGVEIAMGSMVAWERLPEIVRPVGVRQAVILLGVIPHAGEIAVGIARASLLPTMAVTVGQPTYTSCRSCWAAQTMASAATSG